MPSRAGWTRADLQARRGVAPRRNAQPCVVGYAADYGAAWRPGWRDTWLGGAAAAPPGVARLPHPTCRLCARDCALVLQAFAPTAAHPSRLLLVFACNSSRCAESVGAWTALRVLCLAERAADRPGDRPQDRLVAAARGAQKEAQAVALNGGECASGRGTGTLSGNGGDSDSDAEGDLESMQALLELRNVRIDGRAAAAPPMPAKARPAAAAAAQPPSGGSGGGRGAPACLPVVPIEVDFEASGAAGGDPLDADVQRLLARYAEEQSDDDGAGGSSSRWAAEADEPETEAGRALDAFQDCLRRAPGHVVRHQRGGAAVWPTHPRPPPPPDCACGAARVFELQLMPTCLHYVDADGATPAGQAEAGMNWATVAVFTCEDDCEVAGGGDARLAIAGETLRVQADDF
jgi:hypothetical protein